jgi:hypothetical protein
MIVVTGPGRSGTSMLATLYRRLGFDPGGAWNPNVSAGMEEGQVAWMNLHMAEELGVSIRERRGGRTLRAAGALVRKSHGRVPGAVRRPFASLVDSMRYARVAPDLMRWETVAEVAERHGGELRALAKDKLVLKDPRFMWTLRAWLAAGVPVEAVVLTVRPLDAMADSRVRAGMYTPRARAWGKHNYCYGLGLLHTAVAEYRLPLVTLRFPDFLERPEELHRVLPLPEPRSWEEFRTAFEAVYDPALVHDRR